MTETNDRSALFRGVTALAPMATGGNLPYRRLCREFGAGMTCCEMIVAHKLVKGSRRELPLLRRHPDERPFGIQLAGSRPEVLAEAARLAVERHGCDFLDLNFGCPIDVMVRRGLGAAVLKRPGRLEALVAAVRRAVPDVPLVVKLRTGWSERKVNVLDTARAAVAGGADALVVHGRTREQRYRRAADWELIAAVAAAVPVPVLGNGDILTVWDARRRLAETGVAGLSIARGALIKPWIFRELCEDRPWYPTTAERWGILRRYLELAREHFGDDAVGMERVRRFFLWHMEFWHRYRPWTERQWRDALPGVLIQQRDEPVTGDPEAALLASPDPADHERVWRRLLDGDHPGA